MAPAFLLPISPRVSTFTKPRLTPHPPRSSRLCTQQHSQLHMTDQLQFSHQTSLSPRNASSDALSSFATFFSAMPGSWNSERTYHYLRDKSQTREESQTTFDVIGLTQSQISAIISSNNLTLDTSLEGGRVQGYNVSFLTRMSSQSELVRAGTNVAFVVEEVDGMIVKGGYYRDVGYEESGSVSARFEFDAGKMELKMVTFYSRVVSVDEIRLVEETLRLRRIVNYVRVGDGMGPVLLVGYGVEIRGEEGRLVE